MLLYPHPCRFGFNNGKTMVDGLDGENTISHTWQSGDFATIVYQLRLLGFNAVRLPFLFNDLLARKPQVREFVCNVLSAGSAGAKRQQCLSSTGRPAQHTAAQGQPVWVQLQQLW
jgi:hypothetical protein